MPALSPDGTVSIKVGDAWIHTNPKYQLTTTDYGDGLTVTATPVDTPEEWARAAALGYGERIDLMSYEHELFHSLVARFMGFNVSFTLYGVSKGEVFADYVFEGSVVLAFQKYVNDGTYDKHLNYIPNYEHAAKVTKRLLKQIYSAPSFK